MIVEYVLGSALEQLLFTRERYWSELRVALPRVAGLPRFDHLADVTQVGVVALSLILGRTLGDDEYPLRIGEVVAAAAATNAHGEKEPLPAGIRSWLQRALQLDARSSFPSAIEARAEFERVLSDGGFDASPESLDAFMKRYQVHQAAGDPGLAPAVKSATPVRIVPTMSAAAQPTLVASVPVATPALPAPVVPPPSVPPPIVPLNSPAHERHEAKTIEPKTLEHKEASSPWLSSAAELKTAGIKAASEVDEPLFGADVTDSHSAPAWKLPIRRGRGTFVKVAAATAIGVVAIAAVALIGARRFWAEVPAPSPTGRLVVTTNPAGAEAFVDGMRRGNTPLTLELLAGSHRVELRGHGEPRVIPVTIAPGQEVAQYVDLPTAPTPSDTHAEATPEPPAPVERAATEAPASGPGWIAVTGKLEVQLFEDGHLLGTSKIERIMVPAGHHDLEIVNELLGYRGTRSVQVSPGKVTNVAVDMPKGTIAINALPWAEVWMDGNKIGETPIGNFAVPAGSHDVVFRHPEFGEQRETVLVTLKSPVRLSVDMRKP